MQSIIIKVLKELKLTVKYSRKFLKELIELEDKTRNKIEEIVFNTIPNTNPISSGYLEKLQGYDDKYKIRVGNFRIGCTIDKKSDIIYFERVLHRKDIYNVFP